MDKLAAEGLRYNTFHTTALCSPTRAALITGCNYHSAFVYIAGDNGASAEGGIEGSVNENLFFNGFPEKWQDNLKVIDELGGPKHFNHCPSAWAHAMDTLF
jgi:arylsulfatase A-like enzyme